MTNLNKENRAATIESVIKGTFIPDEKAAIIASTSAAVRAQLVSYLPDGFEAAIANLPPKWFDSEADHSLHHKHNPVSILAGKTSGHDTIRFEKFSRPYGNSYQVLCDYSPTDKESPHQWHKVLAAQIDAAIKLRTKEDTLRNELGAFLASCKNYAQVLAKMPELERHLPAPPTKAFPVVTSTAPLLKTLGKLGFDRSVA